MSGSANFALGYSLQEEHRATGAVLSAIAASTCRELPLLFVSLGIGGAWIGRFSRLAPYQPVFLALAAICIGVGFWSLYGRERSVCAPIRSTAT
jgi:mercuric ion transport protein